MHTETNKIHVFRDNYDIFHLLHSTWTFTHYLSLTIWSNKQHVNNTGYRKYFRTTVHVHLPIVLDCHDVSIYVDREVAHTFNDGLATWLNANWNRQDAVAILRIIPHLFKSKINFLYGIPINTLNGTLIVFLLCRLSYMH